MSSTNNVEMSHLPPKGFGPKPPVKHTIIRRKKRAVSFERRFLSARGSCNCTLEIAVIWRDTVMSVRQFRIDNQSRITVGPDAGCDYVLDTGAGKITIAHCINNQWQLLFNNAYDGFVLRGDEKIEFRSASNHEFKVPALNEQLQPGSLACDVTGDVRAKYVFGEVSLLVRYISAVPFAAPLLSRFKAASYGPLAASLVIHFALFSVILFATSRVDALMVDRILSTSRFVVEVEQPIEEPVVQDTIDEVVPDDEKPQETVKNTSVVAPDASPSANNGSGQVMSRDAARKAAQGSGLLTEATRMDSLLAAAPSIDVLNNVELYHFDPTVAAANNNLYLAQTGTKGGLPGVTSISGGPDGFKGKTGQNLVKTGHDTPIINIPPKKEREVKPGPLRVSGTLDRIAVQKIVRQHFGELRACYEREAIKVKGLAGRIVVVWIIAANGSVTKSLVKESTMNNKNVENCVLNSVNHWRFPALKNGGMSQIEYPFDFILNK